MIGRAAVRAPGGAIAVLATALALVVVVATAFAMASELTQPAGTAGCVSEYGANDCADGKGLVRPWSSVVSGDGKHLYVASSPYARPGAIAAFRRDSDGNLTQLAGKSGCVGEIPAVGDCRDGRGLSGAVSLAESPDGKNVYVASVGSDSLAVLRRDPATGALTQGSGTGACVSETGSDGECRVGRGLEEANWVTVSPDGRNVYVASFFSDAIAVFRRNPTTGAVAQLPDMKGCVSETGSGGCRDGKALDGPTAVDVSADGENVYVATYSDAVAVFKREPTVGALVQYPNTGGCLAEAGTTTSGDACRVGRALDGAHGVTVSPNDRNVYVASEASDAIVVLARNATDGKLNQLPGTAGCISDTGTGGACADGRGLDGPQEIALSTDGTSVYAASAFGSQVAALTRNTTTGALTQLPGLAGCWSYDGAGGECRRGRGLNVPDGVVVSPDGKSVYAASNFSRTVAVFTREAPSP